MNFSTFNLGRKIIIDDSLILCLDAASSFSYPGSGNTWFDLSKYQQNVTLYNSPTFNSNIGFGSLQFNGTNQYGFRSLLSPGITNSPFTISTWLYSTSTQATQTWTTIGSALGQVIEGILNLGGNNFYYSDYGSVNITVPNNNILNNWYNVVLYLDSSFAAKMYVNGVLVGSDTATNYLTGNSILSIGTYYLVGPGLWYAGYISNFYVYNRALSEQEILQNYNALKGRFGIF